MRLHHLEVTAFGPFSGTETVDFDALTDAGLFLLCGPTGAGKTSVLDAVSFGLYGEVPGDRNAAKRLRSDHAAPGVAPVVRLEASIAGRRFRIRRSPAWHRPKRRGAGTTLENAKVTLEEQVDGSWVHLSGRLDETGHLLTDLLGMNAGQFCQVAMLPQGRFQSFLRARSDERHKVLQQLFRTGRFEDIERWLVGHRQALKAANRGHQETVASVVSRICEAADAALPAHWELNELASPAESGEVSMWLADLVADGSRDRDRSRTELAEGAAALSGARAELDHARRTADHRSRHRDARDIADRLQADAEQAGRARTRLDAARRAAAVRPMLRLAGDAARAAASTRQSLGPALTDAARLLGSEPDRLDEAELAAAEGAARESAAVARALLPREAELTAAQQAVAAIDRALSEARRTAEQADERCAALPDEISELRSLAGEHAALAAEVAHLEHAETVLHQRLVSARKVADLRAALEPARVRLHASVDAAQAARERMHDVREARINGMAAELAVALAGGASCPVCGSQHHPSPARPVEGAPTQADEQAARHAYEDADFVRQTHAEALSTLEQNVALADQAAGGRTVGEVEEEIDRAGQRREGALAARAEQARLRDMLEEREREQLEAQRRQRDGHAEVARLDQERRHTQEAIDRLGAELSSLFEDDELAGSVQRLVDLRTEAGSVFATARDALAAHATALARSADADRDAADCASEHGFASTDDAASAVLGPDEVEALEQRLASRADELARADAVLTDPEVLAAVQAPEPDLVALAEASRAAEEEHAAVAARDRVVQHRVGRLDQLAGQLRRALDAWAPTRSSYSVAQAVSTFAEGKGGDNTLQVRLSAYVLAARLGQVVAAANERLHRMSDERYTLEHSAVRGVGELRGGLSLQVRDEWTGDARDPATLSGGETFVVSLSLALGLADVVSQESGGTNIDTLFIDEGFGTLDPETLDDVMNTLDGLRDGGRVVGIVSHVPEMRTRVTAQLQVRKGRTGSHVHAGREPV